jgi:hypothetical protein
MIIGIQMIIFNLNFRTQICLYFLASNAVIWSAYENFEPRTLKYTDYTDTSPLAPGFFVLWTPEKVQNSPNSELSKFNFTFEFNN